LERVTLLASVRMHSSSPVSSGTSGRTLTQTLTISLFIFLIITSDSAVRDCFVGCVPGGEFIKDLFLIG
jgi:hypothetical protein